MTVKELSKLYWLNREIDLNKKQLAALEAEIERDRELLLSMRRSLDGMASPKLDGMPHGSDVSSPVENTVEQIVRLESALMRKHEALVNLKALISTRQTLIVLEQDKLERYISTIGDSFTRQIFIFRFVQGLSWEQVASSLDRAEKWESIKQICYRYVRNH